MVKITEMDDSYSEDDENLEIDLDSDNDLQEAFERGILKPGLVAPGETTKPKVYVNNVQGIKRKYGELYFKAPWIERLDLTNNQAPIAPEIAEKIEENEKSLKSDLDTAGNDFQRELGFYRQAQSAVLQGLPRLQSMGIPTKRPEDYFAEMCKTDEHMHKVRENLSKKQTEMENREKIRHFRQLKKFSKKVQAESRVNKAAQKKAMLDEVKKFRKGQRKDLDFLDDDGKKKKPIKKKTRLDPSTVLNQGQGKGRIKRSQLKKQHKDKKYGQGGRKKGKKGNTRESASDVFGFGNKKKGGAGGRGGGKPGMKQPRPGKSKRQKTKGRK